MSGGLDIEEDKETAMTDENEASKFVSNLLSGDGGDDASRLMMRVGSMGALNGLTGLSRQVFEHYTQYGTHRERSAARVGSGVSWLVEGRHEEALEVLRGSFEEGDAFGREARALGALCAARAGREALARELASEVGIGGDGAMGMEELTASLAGVLSGSGASEGATTS